jgi:hypothetical protein
MLPRLLVSTTIAVAAAAAAAAEEEEVEAVVIAGGLFGAMTPPEGAKEAEPGKNVDDVAAAAAGAADPLFARELLEEEPTVAGKRWFSGVRHCPVKAARLCEPSTASGASAGFMMLIGAPSGAPMPPPPPPPPIALAVLLLAVGSFGTSRRGFGMGIIIDDEDAAGSISKSESQE